MPVASIIIACYDHGQFLAHAVSSALAQSEPDIEVLVVDDGSPHDVFLHLDHLSSDPRLKLLRHPHSGLAATRNYGFSLSSAPLVLFLDADDWIAPSLVHSLAQPLLDDHRIWLAYSDVTEVYEGPASARRPAEPYSVGRSRAVTSGNILGSLLCGGYFPVHSALLRRSAVERLGGFCTQLQANEDYDLWLRLAAEGGLASYLDSPLAFYRRHAGNMSLNLDLMESTRLLALSRLFHSYPDAAAAALGALARSSADIFQANLILRQQFLLIQAELDRTAQDLLQSRTDGEKVYLESQSWIAELERAKAWHQEQAARWQASAAAQSELAKQRENHIRDLEAELSRLRAEGATPNESTRDLHPLPGPALPPGPTENL